jgi:hypothetical protein
MGIGSSLFAVLLFVFYIRSPDTLVLYSSPNLLYLVCPLLLCIMGRAWLLVRREVLHEDPVIFAITDVPTQVAVALSALVVWLAI